MMRILPVFGMAIVMAGMYDHATTRWHRAACAIAGVTAILTYTAFHLRWFTISGASLAAGALTLVIGTLINRST